MVTLGADRLADLRHTLDGGQTVPWLDTTQSGVGRRRNDKGAEGGGDSDTVRLLWVPKEGTSGGGVGDAGKKGGI